MELEKKQNEVQEFEQMVNEKKRAIQKLAEIQKQEQQQIDTTKKGIADSEKRL